MGHPPGGSGYAAFARICKQFWKARKAYRASSRHSSSSMVSELEEKSSRPRATIAFSAVAIRAGTLLLSVSKRAARYNSRQFACKGLGRAMGVIITSIVRRRPAEHSTRALGRTAGAKVLIQIHRLHILVSRSFRSKR